METFIIDHFDTHYYLKLFTRISRQSIMYITW